MIILTRLSRPRAVAESENVRDHALSITHGCVAEEYKECPGKMSDVLMCANELDEVGMYDVKKLSQRFNSSDSSGK